MKRQKKELPSMEVSLFCQQTVMILQSGIPLYDGMEVLYRNYEKTEYGAVFEGICAHVREGGSLHEGLKQSELFPDYMCYMVQVGEMTGKLEEVLEALGSYYEREDKIQNSVRSAVLYPLVLTVMMAVVIAILVIRILPVFSQVFQSLGTDLSGMAGTLLSGGVLLGRAVLVVVGVLLAAALVLYLLWSFGGRDVLLRMAGSICLPVRRLMEKQAAHRFASVVSMVLASGYHLEHALELIPDLLPDERNKEKARRCRKAMEESGDFPLALEEAGIFAPLHMKMIQVGTETGQTGQVMSRLSSIYENQVDEGIQNLVSWIEPALVAVLTLVIGGILLSVMLPLVSIMTSIG